MQSNVGRPKDLEKRKQILLSAKMLFLKYGYNGSTMNQIAKHACVTKLTVYNHFQDKATLFTCAIEETCESFMQARPFSLHPEQPFEDQLFQLCELALNMIYLPEALKLDQLLIELAAEKNPLLDQFYAASHGHMLRVWQDFFSQAIEYKMIQPVQIDTTIDLLLSLLLGQRHQRILLGQQAIPEADEIHDMIAPALQQFFLCIAQQPDH